MWRERGRGKCSSKQRLDLNLSTGGGGLADHAAGNTEPSGVGQHQVRGVIAHDVLRNAFGASRDVQLRAA